jgi:hypothetical protein
MLSEICRKTAADFSQPEELDKFKSMESLSDAHVVLLVPRVPDACRKRTEYVLLAPVFENTNHVQTFSQLKWCILLYKQGAAPDKFVILRRCRYC